MADVRTTTTSVTELVPAELITSGIMQALTAKTFSPGLVRQFPAPAASGSVIRFPIEDAADAYTTAIAETASLESVEWSLGEATITVGKVGILREWTWLAQYANILGVEGLRALVIDQDSRQLALTIESDLIAVMNDFTTTVGSSGVNLVDSDMVEAIARARLANADIPGHTMVCVLHPQQVWDWESDIAASGASINAAGAAASMLNANPGGAPGYIGARFGMPIYASTLVPTANAAADRAGGLFPAAASPSDTQAPIIMASLGGVRVSYDYKLERDTDRVAVYYTYGVVSADAARGINIVTDA